MNRTNKLLWIGVLTSAMILLNLGIAQARLVRLGGQETYYNLKACTDGLVGWLAYGDTQSGRPQPNPSSLTGISLIDNTSILNILAPLDDGPVVITDTQGITQSLDYTGNLASSWSNSAVLLPGTRVELTLVMNVPGTTVPVQNPFTLTVRNCTLSASPEPRDATIASKTENLFLSVDDPNTPFCAPGDVLNSSIMLSAADGSFLNRPISDINVALYLHSAALPVVDVRARLTSPEGTTVQLFDTVGGPGTNFGTRASWESADVPPLVGDPMADFLLDDSSDFHFSRALPATCNTANMNIPDDDSTGVFDEFTLPTGGTLTDLNVVISTTHTWVGDLIYELEHIDTGTSVTLIDRPGIPATGAGCGENDILATIDDEALNPVESACSPLPPAISGRFIGGDPANSNLLAAFDGEDLSGTWRLTVSDNAPVDTGMLVQWCLEPTVMPAGIDPAREVSSPFNQTAVHPDENLSAFAGESAIGTWSLELCNRSPDTTSALDTWYLQVEVMDAQTDVKVYLPVIQK